MRSVSKNKVLPSSRKVVLNFFSKKNFQRRVHLIVAITIFWLSGLATGAEIYTFEMYGKEISRTSKIISLPEFGQFGEDVDYFSGSVTFRKTLVEVRGNNNLRVAADYIAKLYDPPGGRPLYVFEKDLPYIEGTHGSDFGWVAGYVPTNYNKNRCSDPRALSNGAATIAIGKPVDNIIPDDYHDGNSLYTPSAGGGLVRPIAAEEQHQSGANVKWATNDGWRFSCYILPDYSEGFIGHRQNGEKYYFGIPIPMGRNLQVLSPNRSDVDGWLDVDKFRMYVTRIEDRFGNWVNYEDGQITSSDGRTITFATNNNGTLIYADGKQWKISGDKQLSSGDSIFVRNPDGSEWSFATKPGSVISPIFSQVAYTCSAENTIPLAYSGEMTVIVKTESGATGTFVFQPRRRGFSFVDSQCYYIGIGSKAGNYYSRHMHFIDGVSLISRAVSGPGISTYFHSIDYGPINACYVTGALPASPNPCTSNSPTTRTTLISGPAGSVRALTYGNKFYENAGLLLTETEGGMKSSSFEYAYLYENYGGSGNRVLGYDVNSYLVSRIRKKTIVLQGNSFTMEVPSECGIDGVSLCFDGYYRPTKIVRSHVQGQ